MEQPLLASWKLGNKENEKGTIIHFEQFCFWKNKIFSFHWCQLKFKFTFENC